jgi:hypothetical protein
MPRDVNIGDAGKEKGAAKGDPFPQFQVAGG